MGFCRIPGNSLSNRVPKSSDTLFEVKDDKMHESHECDSLDY